MNENIEKPEYLYKYISFEQFVDLIENERLYLKKISCWEDCYEGYYIEKKLKDGLLKLKLSEKIKIPKKEIEKFYSKFITNTIKNIIYAQSWIKEDEKYEDAMWRIYSPNKNGIRIKIKRTNIFNQIDLERKSHFKSSKLHQNDIDYNFNCNEKNLEISQVKDLAFKKRLAFLYESEYRFVLILDDKKNFINAREKIINLNSIAENEVLNSPQKILFELFNTLDLHEDEIYYDMPANMIEEIVLDPRASKYFENTFNSYCKNRNLSFSKSKLYKLEN